MGFADPVTLGRTGLRVHRLGIGAGYGVPAETCEAAFHEHGVNFFYYSLSRRGGMKRALRNLLPNHRDDLVVALQSYDHLGPALRPSVELQLRALNLDYADVLILGWHNWRAPWVFHSARKLQEQGKVRHLMMSGHHRPFFAKLAQDADNPIDIFMFRYNAAHPGAETDIFPHLPAENRPGMCAYTTTCWTKLLDPSKMPPGEPPMRARDCYRFALSNPKVDMCLVGPSDEAQMDEALESLGAGPVTADEEERFRRIGVHVHG